ncbi:MAG: hypothetical protein HYW05_01215 [Candidatus Diapherotrites archaeon]|nr:hypothetical protein [Candidatus Diapherotrites archaeon]
MPLPKSRCPKPTINLLDLGFEDAKGLTYFASKRQHKNKKFMGIEWTKQKGLMTRRHNLKLVWGDALNKLRRLPSESVKIITADFLFTEFKVGGFDPSVLGWRSTFFEKEFQNQRIEVAKQIKRILVPNGRFVITEYNDNLRPTQEILNASGFSYTIKPLSETKFSRTTFLGKISNYLEKNPELKDKVKPMRIIAIKLKS